MAGSTKNIFVSEYFGIIPIITTDKSKTYSRKELCSIDSDLKKKINGPGYPWALKAYIFTFSYLNKENEEISTILNNKTFLHYLLESAGHNQLIDSRLPRLIFASDNVVNMYREELRDEKVILISIDKKNTFRKIAKEIIYEIQYLCNDYLVDECNYEDYSICLSNEAISKFIELTNPIKEKYGLLPSYVVKDIQNILHDFSQCKHEYRNINELSALLTFLFPEYHDDVLSSIINNISLYLSNTEADGKDQALLVCKALREAFSRIENTIKHLSIALRSYKVNLIKEFLDVYAKDDEALNEMKKDIKKEFDKPIDSVSWVEILKEWSNIDVTLGRMLQTVSENDPAYSLFEQVKVGNHKMVKDFLQMSKSGINEFDDNGNSLLKYAMDHSQMATFHLLIKFGASIEGCSKAEVDNSFTLLHSAAIDNFEFIPFLLDYGLSADLIDGHGRTPLIYFALSASTIEDLIKKNASYMASIEALAYLLSHSIDYQIFPNRNVDNDFYFSLIEFRKNFSIFYVMYTNDSLRLAGNKLLDDMYHDIVLQISADIPFKAYQSCYQDIVEFLFKNKSLLNQFIMIGMQTAYDDMFGKRFASVNSPRRSLWKEEVSQLSRYYSSNVYSGAASLSAVALAQKELRAKPNKSSFDGRRQAISKWKIKVDNQADQGMSAALIKVFDEIGLNNIDKRLYHKLSEILYALVVKGEKPSGNYSPTLFAQELKSACQEAKQEEKRLKM